MAALVLWVREAGSGRLSVCEAPPGGLVRELLPDTNLRDFYVKCNGRRVGAEEALRSGAVYSVEPRLCGGKGGFGSMLRALGAQIEKTTNREACRDLSGRRLRDVNHEKAMAEWIKKQAEREAEKEQRRLERLKRKLAEPKHYFTDPEYHRQCSDMSERLEDSVIKGLQASSGSAVSADSSDTRKRRKKLNGDKKETAKKQCLWTGLEGLEASSSSGSSSESDYESPSTSASSSSTGQRLPTSDSDSDGPSCSTIAAADRSPEHFTAGSSVAADEKQPINDRDEQVQRSPGTDHREAGGSMQESTEGEQPVCDQDEQEQRSLFDTTTTILHTDHREASGSIQESTEGEQPVCDQDEQEQRSSGTTTTTLHTDREACSSIQETTDVGQPVCDQDEQQQRSPFDTTTTTLHTADREVGGSIQETTDVGQPVCDQDEQQQRSPFDTTTTILHTADREVGGSIQGSTDVGQPVCDPHPPCPSSIPPTDLHTDHREDSGSMQESSDVEQPNVNPQPEKLHVTADTQRGTPSADSPSLDLLAFTSASELEALGLEKLKVELMALGLKCGGTLQERTARLFSVRGLTRERIDPSLFAKPSKGKKK